MYETKIMLYVNYTAIKNFKKRTDRGEARQKQGDD